jgi:glycerophosphoryl diester phosphodiesterase
MRRLTLFILVAIVLAGLAWYMVVKQRVQPMPQHAFFDQPRLYVIAHQGGDGERPSNTMAAFEYAVALGVDVLEMDIHSTRDGVLVVIHDETVDRTTDGTGRVQDFTLAELQQLDAAYHWPTLDDEEGRPTDDFPYRGQGIRIPALEEVLRAFPDMPMTIEIKQRTPSIVEPLCALLRETGMTERALIASFHGETLREFRRICPEVATSAAQDEVLPFVILNLFALGDAYQPTAHALQVPETSSGIRVMQPLLVETARARNVAVHVWTVNEVKQMERMIALGVDGLITDYPARLMELLGRG